MPRSRSPCATVADAPRASPVRAPPCTGVRTSADTSARASGSALRATAFGAGRSARHSSAVAAPLRRVPRRRFPHRSGRSICRSLPPGAAFVSHPTQLAAGARRWRLWHALPGTSGRLAAPRSCWTECMLWKERSNYLFSPVFIVLPFPEHTASRTRAYAQPPSKRRTLHPRYRTVPPNFRRRTPPRRHYEALRRLQLRALPTMCHVVDRVPHTDTSRVSREFL